MSELTFTEYLLSKYANDFKLATQHPFLAQAGEGTIASDSLRAWLKQDYLYAYGGYLKFASSLLSHIHLPTPLSSHPSPNTAKAVSVLTFSLANVKREADFFVTTAKEYGLDIFSPQAQDGSAGGLLGEYNDITRAYVDFLHAVGGLGSVEEGFTLMWAMEIAYLTAWRYAKSQCPASLLSASSSTLSLTQQALLKFIDNWTCDEFVDFVTGCAEMVDGAGIELGSVMAERCEEVFKRTLWLEQRFWPPL